MKGCYRQLFVNSWWLFCRGHGSFHCTLEMNTDKNTVWVDLFRLFRQHIQIFFRQPFWFWVRWKWQVCLLSDASNEKCRTGSSSALSNEMSFLWYVFRVRDQSGFYGGKPWPCQPWGIQLISLQLVCSQGQARIGLLQVVGNRGIFLLDTSKYNAILVLASWSSGRHLAPGSGGPRFESWLCQVDNWVLGKGSLHSCVKWVPNYRQYARVTHHV